MSATRLPGRSGVTRLGASPVVRTPCFPAGVAEISVHLILHLSSRISLPSIVFPDFSPALSPMVGDPHRLQVRQCPSALDAVFGCQVELTERDLVVNHDVTTLERIPIHPVGKPTLEPRANFTDRISKHTLDHV